MCGIVGYIGDNPAYEILIKGLHRLEYRFCQTKDIEGCVGIAHTRWATHGEPNDVNAHPHISRSGRIALVHNGTIENYGVLKEALELQGCTFQSETDTEVLVKLIEYIKETNDCSLVEAVREAIKDDYRRPQEFPPCDRYRQRGDLPGLRRHPHYRVH